MVRRQLRKWFRLAGSNCEGTPLAKDSGVNDENLFAQPWRSLPISVSERKMSVTPRPHIFKGIFLAVFLDTLSSHMIQMWCFAPEPSCYPKDIAKDKLANRKKMSLDTNNPVDHRLLCMACRRCPSMGFFLELLA